LDLKVQVVRKEVEVLKVVVETQSKDQQDQQGIQHKVVEVQQVIVAKVLVETLDQQVLQDQQVIKVRQHQKEIKV
jgi:hypothetical protein